ncbi:hypothetical protein AOQ84DRAFT_294199 [Glonium stellatum]|uniref:Uncharacterized protein n=1 Tax=Glonium stellatum TaxID=574774 RepID=A0A8E2EZY3_9PEZI|nr:hypothetical protein AOQ84DRAFT_294199 [Glonium stellatum]
MSCEDRGIVSIHAYSPGQRVDFYEEVEDKTSTALVWIYFPLSKSKGETITAGWVRELNTSINDRRLAILSTSHQRNRAFGPYIPANYRDAYRFHLIGKEPGFPVTGICYNDMGIASRTQFKFCLLHGAAKTDSYEDVDPQSSFGSIRNLPESPIQLWFCSSASLDGVEQVRVCVDDRKEHLPCVGMLLIYANHEESLGQWRNDRHIEDIKLSGSICISTGNAEAGPYVRAIANHKEGTDKGWREITLMGTIIWWFTPMCSHVDIESGD